ncbi:MAG: restriction endonuclease subunit S [Gammaproteobacteria bacterium]|nr:restriction endonuclease subunit S [Gammaproteobacteria bacterium]
MLETVSLGEIATLYDSLHKTPKDYLCDGEPMIRVTDVKRGFVDLKGVKYVDEETYEDFSKKHRPQAGDILYARVGASYGKSCYVDRKIKFCLGQNLVCISPDKNKVSPFFLYSFLNSDNAQGQMRGLVAGGAQPTISLKSIKEIKLKIPSLREQKEIADAMQAYDNLIENNNRRIAILEDMAQSLYREWFVKFRFPGHENCQFKDSALGRIPVGWEGCELCDFVDFWNGKKCTKSDDGEFPIYGANGIIGLSDQPRYESGIIIGRVGAYCGAVEYCFDKFWGSDNTIIAKCKSEDNLSYLFLLLKFFNLNSYAGGAAQPLLTQATLTRLPFVLPPKNMIEEFDSIAKTVYKSIDGLIKKNTNLREQRDMLLPKLISGKINI